MSRSSETVPMVAMQAARMCEPLLAALHRLAVGTLVTVEDLQALSQAGAVAMYAERVLELASAAPSQASKDWREQGDDWFNRCVSPGPGTPAAGGGGGGGGL